jgi:uncharacterized protein YbdZ (MbtH family)
MHDETATFKVLTKQYPTKRRSAGKYKGLRVVDDEKSTPQIETWYITWPSDRPDPEGYEDTGFKGSHEEVLEYMQREWQNMPHAAKGMLDKLRRAYQIREARKL